MEAMLNKKITIHILSACIVLMTAHRGQSQEHNTNTINITTTAVPFLRILPDARSGGMGDAGMASSPDANSIYYNLAKTPFIAASTGIAASYNPWMKEAADDMYLLTLAGFYRLPDHQALSASVRYFSLGSTPFIDYSGNKLMSFKPAEYTLELGYARQLSSRIGIGITGRYIHSRLATGDASGASYKAGNAVAADISFYYNGLVEKKGWTAGLSLSNLGSKISYAGKEQRDFLPASLNAGGAFTETLDEDNAISFMLDVNKLLVPEVPANSAGMKSYRETGVMKSWFDSFSNDAWQLGLGIEYGYKDLLYLRTGYSRKSYAAGNWQSITAGIGLQWNQAMLNFSYMVPTGDKLSRSPLSNTVRLGVLFNWNERQE
jgi:hypothetical protein